MLGINRLSTASSSFDDLNDLREFSQDTEMEDGFAVSTLRTDLSIFSLADLNDLKEFFQNTCEIEDDFINIKWCWFVFFFIQFIAFDLLPMSTCRAGVEAGDLITLVNEWKVRDDDLVFFSFSFFQNFLILIGPRCP